VKRKTFPKSWNTVEAGVGDELSNPLFSFDKELALSEPLFSYFI
jgi:hypothetical protein